MEDNSSENIMLRQRKRDAEKDRVNLQTVDIAESKCERGEIEDFCIVLNVSRAATLQRALKWAGLKSVSKQ